MRQGIMILCFLFSGKAWSQTFKLVIEVTDFRSDKGMMGYQVFTKEKKPVAGGFIAIKNKTAKVTLDSLLPGEYGVRVFHDENNNQKLDVNVLKIPKRWWVFRIMQRVKWGRQN
ncbi:MAG: DUF2141 domain-containing protein [Chitinophagaceae bacterium]|nr:DUF2141 domain-containing protein [Chitinophagaceae bacterium]